MQEAPTETALKGQTLRIRRIECVAAILLSALAVFLFVVRATHAGSLWRDEAESIQSSRMAPAEMVHGVQFSSFPILFPLILRGFAVLFGAGDSSLRCFGLAVGVCFLLTIWLPLKKFSGSVPLLSISLIGLNANFLIAGMSLRGYGLGSLLMLFAFVCTVRMLIHPTLLSATAVFLADLACSQCLFLNLPLVLSINAAAICVFLFQSNVRQVWIVAAITIACSFAYIPYLSQFLEGGKAWARILQVTMSFPLIWQSFFVAWGEYLAVAAIWIAFIAISLAAVWKRFIRGGKNGTPLRELLLFAIVLIPLVTVASFFFVRFLPRLPESRYFLSLTVVLVASLDLILTHMSLWLRVLRVGLVLVATIVLPFLLWPVLLQAESNASTVAKIVEQDARATDLIVVNPWSYGVSFNWYYHGSARWISVPTIEDHRVHRYDLLLKKMESATPLVDVEDEITTSLKAGDRVWLVGQIELPPPGAPAIQLTPAPDPKFKWEGGIYRQSWSEQISLFLLQHVRKGSLVNIDQPQLVSAREKMSLHLLEGWKD